MSYALIYNPRLIFNFHSIHYQLDNPPTISTVKSLTDMWMSSELLRINTPNSTARLETI